jgi:hypothetical protein
VDGREGALSAALALAGGVLAFVVSGYVESRIMWLRRAGPGELEWISDVILSVAVVFVTYLWLHLRASRTQLASLERQQIALDNELRLAAEIQASLLPVVPRTTPGFEWAARMEAARKVGGDFYDFVPRADGGTLVLLGDVSGKGIPAALIQSSLKTMFRAVAESSDEPAEIATRLAGMLYAETGGTMYATAILARFRPAPPRLSFVSAGHPAGVLVADGRDRELSAGGPPLGLLPATPYEAAHVELKPGERGAFVTDGITEALEGLATDLPRTLRGLPAGDGPERLVEDLFALAATSPGPPGVAGWQDDRTVFAFRVAGPAVRP